jgi:hypothetical protein
MKQYLLVTIDTEADAPKRRPKYPLSLDNVKGIPRLQNLFKKYNVKPVYFITYPVATDKESINILKEFLDKKEIEIGAHLHPWTNPPFLSEREKRQLGYPHNSPLEFEKLSNLTEVIETSFGQKPLSYRAGRYGFDEESLGFLEKLGFSVDSSITPNLNWSFDGGPNFAGFNLIEPYFLNPDNIKKSGESQVLEVPLSIVLNRELPLSLKRTYSFLLPEIKFIFKKTGLIKSLWLRPSISSFEEMKFVINTLTEKGIGIFNMMFHSNEILESASPYSKTKKETENFFLKLEKILDYLIFQKKVESKTFSEIYPILAKK